MESANNEEMQDPSHDDYNNMEDVNNDEDRGGSNNEGIESGNNNDIEVGDDNELNSSVDLLELELKQVLKYKLISMQSECNEQCIFQEY
jgi:hypothetical protein